MLNPIMMMDELFKVASEDELVDELSPLFTLPYNVPFAADSHLLAPIMLDDRYGIHGLGHHMSEAEDRFVIFDYFEDNHACFHIIVMPLGF